MPILVTSSGAWRILNASYSSAFMNLAFDEALARTFASRLQTQSTVRLWVNQRAVVAGRFQEITAEADINLCASNDVTVVRRFTGGGTVYHDERTLNLTIATSPPELSILAFQEGNLKLVSKALRSLGLSSEIELPNSLLLHGHKVCGSAAAIGKSFALWHCSILVDTNLNLLELALAPSRRKRKSRFVRSRWKPVTSLAQTMARPISTVKVSEYLQAAIVAGLGVHLQPSLPTKDEIMRTKILHEQKYSSDEWNMRGKLPHYQPEEAAGQLDDYGGVGAFHALS